MTSNTAQTLADQQRPGTVIDVGGSTRPQRPGHRPSPGITAGEPPAPDGSDFTHGAGTVCEAGVRPNHRSLCWPTTVFAGHGPLHRHLHTPVLVRFLTRLAGPPEERGALVGILTRLLRGNYWGRTSAAVDVAEATREATALLDRHLSEVEPALDRLAAIATTDPDAPLWGVEPPTPVRAPGGTA